MSWRFLEKRAVVLLQAQVVAEHGGVAGLRDESALDAVLGGPPLRVIQAQWSLAELAACYGEELTISKPFVEQNTATALVAVAVFLALHGQRLAATEVQIARTMLAVAQGRLDRAGLASWIRTFSLPRSAWTRDGPD